MGPKTADVAVLDSHRGTLSPKHWPRRKRLTATAIASLKSGDAPYSVSDPDWPGLSLHIPAKLADGTAGARAWQWRFYWLGKRVKLTLGQYPQRSQSDAHEGVREARRLLERGIDPREAGLKRERGPPTPSDDGKRVEPHSVAALVVEFMRRFVMPHRKRPEYMQRILDTEVLKHWRTRDARTLKPRDVIALLDRIVDRGSPTMANRTAAVLTQMFKFAVHRDWLETSPVQLLYQPGGKEKPRDRALDDAELGSLLGSLDKVMTRAPGTASAIRLALYTACRRSEIALARWSDITLDGKAPVWRIPPENSKTGVECLTPLVPAAVCELCKLKKRAGRSPFVFPSADGDGAADPKLLTRSVARNLEALAEHKVGAFTLHDLRRTVRTGLARLQVAPHIAERVLNHAQPGIVAAYDVHRYLDEKRAALTQWAEHLQGLKP